MNKTIFWIMIFDLIMSIVAFLVNKIDYSIWFLVIAILICLVGDSNE